MMETPFHSFLAPGLVFVVSVLVLLMIRNITFRFLHRWAEKTETRIGDVIIATFKSPSLYWVISLSLYGFLEVSDLPPKYVGHISTAIYVIILFSVTVACANVSVKLLGAYVQRADVPIPTTGIVFGVLRAVILLLGILIIFGALGVSITPLLTALGVGGLAVALALQDTLSNLFAGIHIIASRQVRLGEYVRLSSGEDGYVTDITWRNTTVGTLSNNLVVIPNAKFASSIITNFDLPDKEVALSVSVTVDWRNNLGQVEAAALETAREVMTGVSGGVPGYEPSVRFGGFTEGGVQFSVNLRAGVFVDQFKVRHEFIKRLHARFLAEAIRFPQPTGRVPEKGGSN